MALNYDSFRALAERLIRENGADVTFQRNSSADDYDPVLDTATDNPLESFTAPIVFLPLVTGQTRDTMLLQDYQSLGSKAKALLAYETATGTIDWVPTASDQVIVGTDVWTVDSVGPLRPDLTDVIYTLVIHRGAV